MKGISFLLRLQKLMTARKYAQTGVDMNGKLFDSERRVMECLWDEGDLSAKEIAERLNKKVGWSKTTTYTIIRKCVEKERLPVKNRDLSAMRFSAGKA